MSSWDNLYNNKKSPMVGDLICAYHRGIHRVVEVIDDSRSTEHRNKRLVKYVQVADSHYNPIVGGKRTFLCDILYTCPFEESVRAKGFLDPDAIIDRVRRM